MHPTLKAAFNEIDAAMADDVFMQEENRKKLREYLERWNSWDKSSCYFTADGMMCNADGTRSIFDDVDE